MSKHATQVRYLSREEADCIAFDVALDEYLDGGDPEDLLCAACKLVGSAAELDPERAFIVAELTGTCCETLQDYDDAARAIRRWFATTAEPGARH
jgi:hypothetical protein